MAEFDVPGGPDLRLGEPTLTMPQTVAPALAQHFPGLRMDPTLAPPAGGPVSQVPNPAEAARLFSHYADPVAPAREATPAGHRGRAGHGGAHGGVHVGPEQNPITGGSSVGVHGRLPVGPVILQGGAGVSPKKRELHGSAGVSLPITSNVEVGVQGEVGTDPRGHTHGSGGFFLRGRF